MNASEARQKVHMLSAVKYQQTCHMQAIVSQSIFYLSHFLAQRDIHQKQSKSFFSLSNEYTMCWFTSVMTWGFILFEFLYSDIQISWKNNQRQSAIACSIFFARIYFYSMRRLIESSYSFQEYSKRLKRVYSLSKPYQYRTVHIWRSLFVNLH